MAGNWAAPSGSDDTIFVTIETRPGDGRAIMRLSGTAGLDPVPTAGWGSANPLTQQLCAALAADPAVSGVLIVTTAFSDSPKRNIVVFWQPGADVPVAGMRAWAVVREVLGNAELRSAYFGIGIG